MKKKLGLLFSWPILIGVGWLATKLSERYGNSLADFDVEFDYE